MFIQVISGTVHDAAEWRRQAERWNEELRPGATGYLGSTGGVAADGRSVVFARFDSEASARANSDRPEQGAWWAEMAKCYADEPEFADATDVQEFMGGGSNEAGFVQFMKVKVSDRAKLAEIDEQFEKVAPEGRPDIIGGLRAWTGPDTYVEAAYFTSEAEARKGESAEAPAELQQAMADWQQVVDSIEFIDITEPWLV